MKSLFSRKPFPACVIFLALVSQATGAAPPGAVGPGFASVGGPIDGDTIWEGTIRVVRQVTVKGNARLTIRPGARLLFASGTELHVAGTLRAAGTPGNPIHFQSADPGSGRGSWMGVTLAGAGGGSVLSGCVVKSAEGIRVLAGNHEITGSTLGNGATGIFVGRGAFARIAGNTISGIAGAGIDCQKGASAFIDNNVIRGCGTFGVNAQRDSAPNVTNNTIAGCDIGVSYSSPAPSPEGNRIEDNRVGIGINNVGDRMSFARNRFVGNGTGLWIENFSSPRVEANVFDNNGVGIFCYRSSSPRIEHNRIVRNGQGIVCQQLSEPRIIANELAENRKAVFLTLSSYAVVNGNNFDNNAVQVELGLMSYDWEVRAGRKPARGDAMRGTGRYQRLGVPPPESPPSSDAAVGSGTVDATGNWWGERDTAEMEAKGADANIGSLIDGRDVPPQKSEGYEGEFARDRIDYGQWKKEKIPDVGALRTETRSPPAGPP